MCPAVFIPLIEPFVRETAVAYEAGVLRPSDQILIGLMDLPEHGRIPPEIGVVDLDLAPVGVSDDPAEFWGVKVRFFEMEINQGRGPNVRCVKDRRLDGLWRNMVPDGLVEDMERGKIPFLGATLFRPPGFAKDVRHPAEVFARIPARGPRVEKAVDLLLSAGQEVHHDQ